MPPGLHHVRTTPEFTSASTPAGLRAAHRVAAGVWGRLRVREGVVRFVFETPPGSVHDVRAGESLDIPPQRAHRVEPGDGARFVVEFHARSAV
jgi:tellurite resistance-related uncharacterized protein